MTIYPNIKICNECKLFKSLDLFYNHPKGKYGKQPRCKDCDKSYQKTLKRKIYQKEYQKTSKFKESRKEYRRTFIPSINSKLAKNLRRRLNSALHGNSKRGSAVKDLGCTIEFLKEYITSKFEIGMTWQNYGFYGWHMDHIIPLDSFDLTDRDQFLKACHYTNLQPLWALDNFIKRNSIN